MEKEQIVSSYARIGLSIFLLCCLLLIFQGCNQHTFQSSSTKTCQYEGFPAACGELLIFHYDIDLTEYENVIRKNNGIVLDELEDLNMIRVKFETDNLPAIKAQLNKVKSVNTVGYNHPIALE